MGEQLPATTTKFAGFDCSSRSIAWAVLKEDRLWKTGFIETQHRDINEALKELHHKFQNVGPDLLGRAFVAIEEPIHIQNFRTSMAICRTVTLVRITMWTWGLDSTEIPNTVWKKALTGRGNCHKEEILETVNGLFDIKLLKKEQDVADAIGIAWWCYKHLGK